MNDSNKLEDKKNNSKTDGKIDGKKKGVTKAWDIKYGIEKPARKRLSHNKKKLNGASNENI